ncbi:MAG: hypothetical protein ACRDYX_05400 [Egibacteraceae bacterium]
MPNLQVGGQVANFLTKHLDAPVPSPAMLGKIGNRFRAAVTALAEQREIPVIRFGKDDRKIDVVRPYPDAATGPGVVAIGVAQEFQSVFAGNTTTREGNTPLVQLRQGRPAGDLLLLGRLGRPARPGIHQDLLLLPVPGQGVKDP